MTKKLVSPEPAEIRKARKRAKLTQAEAAQLLGVTTRCWQYWESGDRRMTGAYWQLFKMLTTTESRERK